MEDAAVKKLGLLPWQIERLTPAELEAQLDGWQWRRDRDLELLAYFTAWQIGPHVTKAVQPDDIVPPDVKFRRMQEQDTE